LLLFSQAMSEKYIMSIKGITDDNMNKATAKAHPIQGLIKYHGLKDEHLKIPYHDSISVCTGPISTITTVEPREDLEKDTVQVNGKVLEDRELERAVAVLQKVRELDGTDIRFKVISKNDFKTNIGLGASSSGFAALAMAACAALEMGLGTKEISRIARLGAGSACRSITGGFSRWVAGNNDETSFAHRLDDGLEMGILAIEIEIDGKFTEKVHEKITTSPYFDSRIEYIKKPLLEMEDAISTGDIAKIGLLAETDTYNLHAVTMTTVDNILLWKPETIKAIEEVKRLRKEEGIDVFFSIDTGATPYINTSPDNVDTVKQYLEQAGFTVTCLEVGPGASLLEEHLF